MKGSLGEKIESFSHDPRKQTSTPPIVLKSSKVVSPHIWPLEEQSQARHPLNTEIHFANLMDQASEWEQMLPKADSREAKSRGFLVKK